PTLATRRVDGVLEEVPVSEVEVGDIVVVLPNGVAPVDGEVIEGHGTMDESFLTGEPFEIQKAPGSTVISGALNGHEALVVRATRKAEDSRYAQIMAVMQESQQNRPRIRRLADRLGASTHRPRWWWRPSRGSRAAIRCAFSRCWWWRHLVRC